VKKQAVHECTCWKFQGDGGSRADIGGGTSTDWEALPDEATGIIMELTLFTLCCAA
jgi:hypothetical protein